jgi:hypothetical protein
VCFRQRGAASGVYAKSSFSSRPYVRTVPSISATVTLSRCRRVDPYRKLRDPLALVAMVPPIEAPHSVGSGA